MTGHAARLLKAVGALVALLAVLVGVPVLMAVLHLVPDSLPSLDEVGAVLTSRDNGQLAGLVLAAGVWVCWALFTAATVAEIVAYARARPVRPLPGLGILQRLAAALVTAVAVGFTASPLAAGAPASTATAPPPLPVAAASTVVPSSAQYASAPVIAQTPVTYSMPDEHTPPVGTTTYQVQRRDTLWALAERYLGDPLRYPEIAGLNPTAVGPDNEILPGTVLVLPPDAVGLPPTGPAPTTATTIEDVTVEPGDTLWDLTEEITGSGHNWRQAWELNRGRSQPGGATFTDPSLIRPGWTLSIPDSASPATPAPSPPAPPAAEPAPPTTPAPPSAPGPSTAPPADPTTPGTNAPPPAAPGPATNAPTSSPTAAPNSVEPSPARPDETSTGSTSELPMIAFAAGGGLLLAGASLTALLRYRRRQFRQRRPGRTIGSTPPELVHVERALLEAGSVGSADVTWLDQALRALVQALAKVDGAHLPDVVAACMTDDVLTLVLTEPASEVPKPWTVDPAGTRWSIRRDVALTYDEQRRAYFFAPFPMLASVGYTAEGEHWLLDLERVATLSLSGDAERCLNLARFLGAELAHNTWSEMLQVTLVGFGKELAQINPDRLTYTDDVEKAIGALDGHLESVTEAMQMADVDVLSGRMRDVAGDAWAPHVLLIAPDVAKDGAGVERLLTAMKQQRARGAVALVLIDDADHADAARWQLTVDEAGMLSVPALGVELIAQQIPADEAAQLAQVLALATVTDDRPVPPSRGDEDWDRHADACGGLRIDPTRSAQRQPPFAAAGADDFPAFGLADTSPWMTNSVLPLSAQTYLDRAATTEQDLEALAPATDARIRDQVEVADPALDADLADWADPSCPRPKLILLGPVAVRAQDTLPERNPRRQFYTEIVAYLATRPGGVTSERYATAIWPNEPDVVGKTKVRQSISIVRAWLGVNPATGADYLPSGVTAGGVGRYRIDDVLIDAELFRRLRVRGLACGVDGIADLRAALDLVTGRPFDLPASRQGSPGGYSWLVEENSRLDHEYAAMIVDVAHTVATHHLAAGKPELAAAAAHVALKAGSYEDVPLLDLVAACDAQGNRAEADAYVARILANHDAEVEEDLPPRTAEILFRRQWINRAS
ncbi:LysM peptidoglycan-binding domain-containing protein [Blastococcus goldschmidtiae]|uniref:LysM peptidoglycan-binding domain-containing protein n=1 Tax=Blastococcus goldschmidtiae TaxID=3075546 RepID=A0ABU2K7A8_9ACTN|nr:LysM peptidoglycan-binding domain-containing protein [Blastococcus sp. DSM 46792]MDT0276058.1 LysM peptidoglycan-binding domain-containing protein [Blastococcus sp. DSM 46792]